MSRVERWLRGEQPFGDEGYPDPGVEAEGLESEPELPDPDDKKDPVSVPSNGTPEVLFLPGVAHRGERITISAACFCLLVKVPSNGTSVPSLCIFVCDQPVPLVGTGEFLIPFHSTRLDCCSECLLAGTGLRVPSDGTLESFFLPTCAFDGGNLRVCR